MPAIGITGGIATGKSTFAEAFRRYLPATFFDADRCAEELLANDPAVRQAVRTAFGPEAFLSDGQPDRAWLRRVVFADSSRRHDLEQILHPAIRARWSELAAAARSAGHWVCVDIPLLFETHAEHLFTAIIVVACSPAVQRARLRELRHLPDEIAEQILAAQLDLAAKIVQADHLIWNESTVSCLDRQARLLADALRRRHG